MHFKAISLLLGTSALLVVLSGAGDAAPAQLPDAGVTAAADDAGPDNGIGTSPSDPEPTSASVTTTSSTTVRVAIPDPQADPGGYVAAVLASARAGEWRLLAAALLIGAFALARWGLAKIAPWFATDRGGAALVLLLSLLAGLGTSLAADQWSGSLLVNTLLIAFTAAGGFNLLKKIFAPSDVKAKPVFTHVGNQS